MANTKETTYKTKTGLVFVNIAMTEEERHIVDIMRGDQSRGAYLRNLSLKDYERAVKAKILSDKKE